MRRFLPLLALSFPGLAHADGWFVVETPAALVLSDAQSGVFRPGVMPAIGAYAENSRFALGLRLRGGILRNGPAPGAGLDDPGVGGLTTGSAAIRVSALGGWLELAAGGGITGSDLVPAVEAGVGWSMAIGSLDIGPSVRYVRVESHDSMAAFGTAELVLAGVDIRFGRERPRARVERREPPPVRMVAAAQVAAEPVEADHDRVVDLDDSCTREGCRLSEDIVLQNDRIILDERILFDFNRARVRSRGREAIAQLTKIWHEHPDWVRITVEGHADVRGTDGYNQALSQLRASRVRDVMIELGCTGASIEVVGYGRSRIRDAAETEDAHQRNRRVEFVIERGGNL